MSPSETTQPRGGAARPAPRGAASPARQPGAPARPASRDTASPARATGARPTTGVTTATGAAPRPSTPVDDRSATDPGRDGAAARPGEASPPRRVRLTASRVNPWSAFKLALLLSVALGIIAVVAVFVLWSVLNGMGVFSHLDGVVRDVVGSEGSINLISVFSLSHVLSVTVVFAVLDVVLLTVLATLAAVLYNLSSSLVGGLKLTLTDD